MLLVETKEFNALIKYKAFKTTNKTTISISIRGQNSRELKSFEKIFKPFQKH